MDLEQELIDCIEKLSFRIGGLSNERSADLQGRLLLPKSLTISGKTLEDVTQTGQPC